MGMFDSEVPKELTPLQQIQQAAGEVAEKTAPWMKKTLNYESPKREMRRVASETDLSDTESIQKTFNFLMNKNPKAAVAWRKSVMPIVEANLAQQKAKVAGAGRTLKPEEAHLNSMREQFYRESRTPEEAEAKFGNYVRDFKVQYTGTVKPDYEMYVTPKGRREQRVVPGSAAAAEIQANKEKIKLSKESLIASSSNVLSEISGLREMIKKAKKNTVDTIFGATAAASSTLPWGTARNDAESKVITIYAAIGFDKLQAMREESPTGGALGQVSEMELEQLNNSIASLKFDQTEGEFLKNLHTIEKRYKAIIDKAMRTGDGTFHSKMKMLDSVMGTSTNNSFNW